MASLNAIYMAFGGLDCFTVWYASRLFMAYLLKLLLLAVPHWMVKVTHCQVFLKLLQLSWQHQWGSLLSTGRLFFLYSLWELWS